MNGILKYESLMEEQSRNFVFRAAETKLPPNRGNYTVDFALMAVEVQTDTSMSPKEVGVALNAALRDDKSGAGNVFRVVGNSDLGADTNGTTTGGNFIQVKDAQKTADTGAHEVGHTLGLAHSSSGLMTSSSTDSNRSGNLNTGRLKDMVTYPLAGKTNSDINEKGKRVEAGKGTVMYFRPSYSTEKLYNPLSKKGKIGR